MVNPRTANGERCRLKLRTNSDPPFSSAALLLGQEFNSFRRKTRSNVLLEFKLHRQEKFLYVCDTLDMWEWDVRVVRGDNRAQTASSFQNGLSVGSPCQPNDQASHKGIPSANRIFDDYFRSRSAHQAAPIPERRARRTHRDANPRRVRCFRESGTFGDSVCIAGRIGCCLAGSQP
jgi:hypothetical protein